MQGILNVCGIGDEGIECHGLSRGFCIVAYGGYDAKLGRGGGGKGEGEGDGAVR